MSLTPAHPGGLGGGGGGSGGKVGGKAGGGLRLTAAHSPDGVSTGVYVRGGARRWSGGELALGEWRWKPSGRRSWTPHTSTDRGKVMFTYTCDTGDAGAVGHNSKGAQSLRALCSSASLCWGEIR